VSKCYAGRSDQSIPVAGRLPDTERTGFLDCWLLRHGEPGAHGVHTGCQGGWGALLVIRRFLASYHAAEAQQSLDLLTVALLRTFRVGLVQRSK
jgi:hypothetical protein